MQGLIQFITPAFLRMATMVFVVVNGGAEGFQYMMGMFHTDDLRDFRG